jgi:hypothetical protein
MMGGGGACAVLVSFTIQHPIVGGTNQESRRGEGGVERGGVPHNDE